MPKGQRIDPSPDWVDHNQLPVDTSPILGLVSSGSTMPSLYAFADGNIVYTLSPGGNTVKYELLSAADVKGYMQGIAKNATNGTPKWIAYDRSKEPILEVAWSKAHSNGTVSERILRNFDKLHVSSAGANTEAAGSFESLAEMLNLTDAAPVAAEEYTLLADSTSRSGRSPHRCYVPRNPKEYLKSLD